MMIIREYVNEMEALVAHSVLEANDIEAIILHNDACGMLPFMNLQSPLRIAVRERNVTEALRLLDLSGDPDPGFTDSPEDPAEPVADDDITSG